MTDPLTYHTRFGPADFDARYNLRAGRPDYEQTVIPGWSADGSIARETCDTLLDRRYGAGDKQKLDVVRCGIPSAPGLVHFHSGKWQRGDKSI